MQKLLREYLDDLKKRQRKSRKAAIAAFLLVVMVVGSVTGILAQYGMAMTGAATCGLEEHQHGEGCYADAVICGLEESAGHTHSEECRYPQELTCSLEENEQHAHGAECYLAQEGFACGLEESAGHAHGETCYAKELTCGKAEHAHTDICYIDTAADVEDQASWNQQYDSLAWTGAWGADLVMAARPQIGYQESVNNYTVAENGNHKGYTRYGQFAGELYADWDAAFVNFCMHYAGLEASGLFPKTTDSAAWQEAFANLRAGNADYLTGAAGYGPQAGDLVFFRREGEETAVQMGIVSSYNEAAGRVSVIEGNSQNAVRENEYEAGDSRITGYLKISGLEAAYKNAAPPEAGAEQEAGDPAAGAAPEANADQEADSDAVPEKEAEAEAVLTEEERRQAEAAAALIGALPEWEEVSERFTALLEAEDEEGCSAYYQQLYAQVCEAQNAYEALTEMQKAQVAGAEKLSQFEWMQAATLEENSDQVWNKMGPDEAYVNAVSIGSMVTGSAPFDGQEGDGNDTTAEDRIVRTFDTVTYNFNVEMKSWDDKTSYSEARVRLEFVLPLTEGEAVFDQSAMGWMDQTAGYRPELTTEMRVIDGVERECQVLTCYKHLLPAENNPSVVPGNFGENLTVYVRSMKKGAVFAPVISAAMEGGAWDGPCDKDEHKIDGVPAAEKKTVIPEEVRVTAAPKYNIQVKGEASYTSEFNFQGDEAWMNEYGDVAANTDIKTPMPGRAMKLGITLQLYNDNAAKGLKGIELPDENEEITFDLELSSKYTINTPKEGSGYKQGDRIDVTGKYGPLLWSYNELTEREYGAQNKDGRPIYDSQLAKGMAPWNSGDDEASCHQGGTWTASQEGSRIHITVKGYEIDLNKMPVRNGDWGQPVYGDNVGCFSSGELWLVQPFNQKEGTGEKPYYDVVTEYGQGAFATEAKATKLKVTTETGDTVIEGENGFQQMVTKDDVVTRTLELILGGSMQNRVRYGDPVVLSWGSGVQEYNQDGRDYAAAGSQVNLMGGLSFKSNFDEKNRMYLGTNLLKFYGSVLELEDTWVPELTGGASLDGNGEWNSEEARNNIRIYYATKKDGTDWRDDHELQNTYEDSLDFYDSLDKIPEGKTCVGMLIAFVGRGPDPDKEVDPYYLCYHKAKVKEDPELIGEAFMLASTSRAWTKEMFDEAGVSLELVDLEKNPALDVSGLILSKEFESLWNGSHYKSANIKDSVYYIKETYREDGSGIKGTHNSEWFHWGDTLLVIGYKTSITKNLQQMIRTDDGGEEEKKSFSLDQGQRVADFKLQPRTYYDEPGDYDHTATVTVVDTLPKYMSYKPGSAYFGGAYEQTSVQGGTKGNIVRDETEGAEFPDPEPREPEVKTNEDGTQTLTWRIENVKIGEPMAPVYYSADIGVQGNPGEDIPVGTMELKNTVYITTPWDLRDPETTAEKHSEAGISVVRGTASAFGKYTKQKVAEEDGVIDYVVYYNNNADQPTQVQFMDTMPMDQISGSDFTGTYVFAGWRLDVAKCDAGALEIYYTFDKKYEDMTAKDLVWDGEGSDLSKWTKADFDLNTGEIELPVKEEGDTEEHPTAWAVKGELGAGRLISIDLQIKLEPGASATDKTGTNYFVNRLSSGDTTTVTETPTVRRNLEGLVWMDRDQDGIQGSIQTEERISGVRVELLRLKEGADPNEEASYENVCYPGTNTPIVIETGKQISLRAKDENGAVEYETGRYRFTDLPAGMFAVRFTDGSGETKITELHATEWNCGPDDTLDSDGVPVYGTPEEEEGGSPEEAGGEAKLLKTLILNLEMPKIEDMHVAVYDSKYHDSGFYPDTVIGLRKTDENGRSLSGAMFTMEDSGGRTLTFTYEEGKGYTLAGEEEADPSLQGKYYIAYAADPRYVVEIDPAGQGGEPVLKKRNGNPGQLFEVRDLGGTLRAFYNPGSWCWMNLDGGVLEDGRKIHVWGDNEQTLDDNNKWYLTDAGGGLCISPFKAGSGGADWCMGLDRTEAVEGAGISLRAGNKGASQKWMLVPADGSSSGAAADLAVDGDGRLTIHNLAPGDYMLTEIRSPEGHALIRGPVAFTLNPDGTVTSKSSEWAGVEAAEDGKNIILTIKNEKLYELPEAGGPGIYWYSIGGTLLMLAAALILYKNKCNQKQAL